LVYFLFKLFTIWVKRIPLKSLRSYGETIGTITFHILGKARRIALNNLHLALGNEKSEEEINRICQDSFKNIGKDMMEVSHFPQYEDSYLRTLVRLEGREFLDQALRQGKGVVAISAHLGNFTLMAIRLAKEGYPLSIVTKYSKNPKIVKFLTSYADAVGIESIPDKPRMTCVAQSLKALKENRILMIHIDLNAPTTEAWVDFFGYLVPTYKGPVVISFRTGALIVPIFTIRNADQLHQVIIHPPLVLNITEDKQRDIHTNTAKITKIVEAMILKYPEQWWWIHPRFRRARDIQTGKRLFPKHP
jgi:KDO2-lipid IV(A) lauroyltransferase